MGAGQSHLTLSSQNSQNQYPLHTAVYMNQVKLIKKLLVEDASIAKQVDKDGNTGLHIALKKGYLACAIVLYRANPRALGVTNQEGYTPIQRGWNDQLRVLIQFFQKCHLNFQDFLPVLLKEEPNKAMIAAIFGEMELVQKLISEDEQVLASYSKQTHSNLLLLSIYSRNLILVQWLYAQAPQLLNEKNNNGNTALLLAACNGQIEMVKWLLDHGARLDEKNKKNKTSRDYLIKYIEKHPDMFSNVKIKKQYGNLLNYLYVNHHAQEFKELLLKEPPSAFYEHFSTLLREQYEKAIQLCLDVIAEEGIYESMKNEAKIELAGVLLGENLEIDEEGSPLDQMNARINPQIKRAIQGYFLVECLKDKRAIDQKNRFYELLGGNATPEKLNKEWPLEVLLCYLAYKAYKKGDKRDSTEMLLRRVTDLASQASLRPSQFSIFQVCVSTQTEKQHAFTEQQSQSGPSSY